jgi:hypothetical protein
MLLVERSDKTKGGRMILWVRWLCLENMILGEG